MFKIGDMNSEQTQDFLSYLEKDIQTGICVHVQYIENYNFIADEIERIGCFNTFPIESEIQRLNKKCSQDDICEHKYFTHRKPHNSTKTNYGKLRRWWVYNLAVVVSNKKI